MEGGDGGREEEKEVRKGLKREKGGEKKNEENQ